MGLRMKKFNVRVNWKNWFLGGGGVVCMKNQHIGVNCLKKVAWIVCIFKRELGKKEGVMFLRGDWDPKACYELEEPSYWHKYPKQITLCDNNTVILLIIRPSTWYTISIICHYFQCQCTFFQILSLFPDFSPLFITFLTVIRL